MFEAFITLWLVFGLSSTSYALYEDKPEVPDIYLFLILLIGTVVVPVMFVYVVIEELHNN
jgi:hypothetical protein